MENAATRMQNFLRNMANRQDNQQGLVWTQTILGVLNMATAVDHLNAEINGTAYTVAFQGPIAAVTMNEITDEQQLNDLGDVILRLGQAIQNYILNERGMDFDQTEQADGTLESVNTQMNQLLQQFVTITGVQPSQQENQDDDEKDDDEKGGDEKR